MINILVVEDDLKLNQIVCTHLNDNRYKSTGYLNAQKAYEAMYNSFFHLSRTS